MSFFGPPATSFVQGGAHIAVYLLPVYNGQLVVFDVEAAQARGRWLPWDILPWQGNPYELASEMADLWCQVPLADLALADVMSFPSPEDAWELAIVFRAELAEPARGDDLRTPYFFPHGQFDAIGPFDPIDLERWVTGTVTVRPGPGPSESAPVTPVNDAPPVPAEPPSEPDSPSLAEGADTAEVPPKPGPLLF
jgi:hypothetical protein